MLLCVPSAFPTFDLVRGLDPRVSGTINKVRAVKENKLRGGGRQVDAASMFDAYAHPTISTLALDWDQDKSGAGTKRHGDDMMKTFI